MTQPATSQIRYTDAALEKLLLPQATLEIIASGFQHAEGPLWFSLLPRFTRSPAFRRLVIILGLF